MHLRISVVFFNKKKLQEKKIFNTHFSVKESSLLADTSCADLRAYVIPALSNLFRIKCARSGLRQFLPTESLLKIMKNAFYFTSKALFVLKI